MFNLFFTLLVLFGLFFFWFTYLHEEKLDIIFLVLSISFFAITGVFLGNDWVVRSRHLVLPFSFVWSIFYLFNRKRKLVSLPGGFIVLFILIYLASLWSTDPGLALQLKFKNVAYPVLFLVAGTYVDTYKKLRSLVLLLSFSAVMVVFSVLFSMRSIGPVDERLVVGGLNTNTTASFLSATIMVLLGTFIMTEKKYKFCLLPVILLAVPPLFMTGSRAAILSTLGAAFVALSFYFKSVKSCCMAVVSVLIGLLGYYHFFWRNLNAGIRDRVFDVSNMSGRSNFWQVHLDSVLEHLWFGIGTIYYVSPERKVAWGSMLNIYLNIYVETGIVGSIIGGCLFGGLLYYIVWILTNVKNRAKFYSCSVIVLALAYGIGESASMRGSHPLTLLFMIFIGVIANLKKNPRFFKEAI
jgi:O-antigen ligase